MIAFGLRNPVTRCALLVMCFAHWCSAQEVNQPAPKPAFVPKITVSKETTWATEPVGANGFVDYFTVLNRQSGQGVTFENNAVVVLSRALGPQPERQGQPDRYYELLGIDPLPKVGRYFEDPWQWWERKDKKLPAGGEKEILKWEEQANARPWSAKEFPELAEWLSDNEGPLQSVVEASERTEFFSPLFEEPGLPLCEVLLSVQSTTRRLCRALVTRAMLQLGEENRFDAWNDLLAAHRLSRLIGRGPFAMDGLVGYGTEREVMAGELRLISETQPSSKFTSRYLKQLDRLPPISPIIDKIENAERAAYLDMCQQVAHRRVATTDFAEESDAKWHEKLVEDVVLRQIDWDEVLRTGNRRCDRLVAALRRPTYRERETAFSPWDEEFKTLSERRRQAAELFTTLKGKPALTVLTSDVLTAVWFTRIRGLHHFETKCRQRSRNLEIALALSAWRSDHDSYPKSLDDLAPQYLTTVPTDFFTDQPLRYERTADGYRFYSFGPNGTDDQGRGESDLPAADDLIVQMPLPLPKAKP